MSTAIAEPPVEQKPDIVVPPTEAIADAVKEVAKEALKPEEPKPDAPKEEKHVPIWEQIKRAKPEAKKPDDKPAEEKPVEKVEKKEPSPAARENFEKLEKRAIAAEEALQATTKERDEFKLKVTELSNAEDQIKSLAEQLEAERAEKEEAIRELRAASIERDPAFKKKYVESRKTPLEELARITGKSQTEIDEIIKSGNDDAIDDIKDSLRGTKLSRFEAALVDLDRIEIERKRAIGDANETAQSLAEERQKQSAQQVQQLKQKNLQVSKEVMDSMFNQVDAWRDDTELRDVVEQQLAQVSAGEWSPKQILGTIVVANMANKAVAIQAKVIESRNQELQARDTKIAELEKKIAEQDEFIKNASGDVPRGEVNGSNGNGTEEYIPSWKRIGKG
jgi:hypothetical protein